MFVLPSAVSLLTIINNVQMKVVHVLVMWQVKKTFYTTLPALLSSVMHASAAGVGWVEAALRFYCHLKTGKLGDYCDGEEV